MANLKSRLNRLLASVPRPAPPPRDWAGEYRQTKEWETLLIEAIQTGAPWPEPPACVTRDFAQPTGATRAALEKMLASWDNNDEHSFAT
jgi:hypothetical protein